MRFKSTFCRIYICDYVIQTLMLFVWYTVSKNEQCREHSKQDLIVSLWPWRGPIKRLFCGMLDSFTFDWSTFCINSSQVHIELGEIWCTSCRVLLWEVLCFNSYWSFVCIKVQSNPLLLTPHHRINRKLLYLVNWFKYIRHFSIFTLYILFLWQLTVGKSLLH